ncbi:T9SS type A sorting domain-containing protein [Pontibacter locisalis]|uniref:T9SS type A sorting domain-containing protein n=1 Tax=Pontibacter locisalis TaxID=1719035 RepID=A0ABW5INZ1_9BACT
MNTNVLLNLLKLLLGLLIFLLPLQPLLAQKSVKEEEPKTMRIKLFKSVDGKLFYSKDTVINVADHVALLRSVKDIKLDTASWQRLRTLRSVKVDTLVAKKYFKMPLDVSYNISQDSALGKRLKGTKVQVYKMRKAISEEDKAKLFERMKGAGGDTFLIKTLEQEKVYLLHADSVMIPSLERLRFNEGEEGKSFRIISSDSSWVTLFNNSATSSILINGEQALRTGGATAQYTTSDSIKIETDSTGKTTVYRINEAGNKEEIDGYHFGRSGQQATVIVLHKTKVEDITSKDVKALQDAGAKVEAKDELEVEAIEYYPNPNNGRFHLKFKLNKKGTTVVRVMDSKGDEVFVDTVEKLDGESSREINLMPFGPGIYFLQIVQGKKLLTKKILVK